ncbi:aminoglycoside phosphotransferase family protein [Streptomyces sp. RKND-216]|uniref:phosphotransferase n=1 Tax=Streptomyces sp. RKND-216 TaxID=2562581 RepID=UPI00109DA171|nr:phosphotransferase [Streptomyces sp. RKND-216]THA27299.1 aminoglycoside phosphotransferase family protein [Streptomyces sp. RKND-216]
MQQHAPSPPPSRPSPAAELAALLPPPRREPVLLADRPDGTVVRAGGAVAKAHAPDVDPSALAVRLRVAADPALRGVLLPPLCPAPVGLLHDGRPATAWPYGVPVDPADPEAAPWEEAGTLLARLHTAPHDEIARRHGPLPPMRGPLKAAAAVTRMRAAQAADAAPAAPVAPVGGTTGRAAPEDAHASLDAARHAVEGAWARLPAWCRAEAAPPPGRPRALCHGDFHLGQLVRHPPPEGRWQLIDIDDLGLGDPAWDLARPAAWFAAGLLPPAAWERLLLGYLAVRRPPVDDLWDWLDEPARALTVQTAAVAVAKATPEVRALDVDERALVEACCRIVELPCPARP